MTQKELDQIAHDFISRKIAAGEIVHMPWSIREIINERGIIEGPGKDFYSLCAQEHVYRTVKRAVDRYDAHESASPQLTLQGFNHLQTAYTVERNKERQLVPLQLLSHAELLERAQEFRRQASGLIEHADEIEAYVMAHRKAA